MATPQKKLSHAKSWRDELIHPDRWEAPDRSFSGHRDILTRNLARYHFIKPHLGGDTLEVGCGRGYGMEIIWPQSNKAIGLDISPAFLQEARSRLPHIVFVRSCAQALPFLNHTFDSIVAFEVIEHIPQDNEFLEDLHRLVRGKAFVALSTPNKWIASGEAAKPLNPFHVREYAADEFRALLLQVFSSVILYGQHDRWQSPSVFNRLIDCIPIRWKYILPAFLQGCLSVALRSPLQLEECQFETENLETAHTFLALCHP